MAVNYTIVDAGQKGFHEDHWAIQILEGELEGYTFQFDTVKINENEDGEGATLEFNTITVEDVKNDLTDEQKRDIIGDILTEIILEQIENADGTPDTEQPTE